MNFINVQKAAEKWQSDERSITRLCRDGRVPGAVKDNGKWLIPANADRPKDGRRKKKSLAVFRKPLPIGVSDFKEAVSRYYYVDKTMLVYQLASSGKCYFLSRPRRFGKSLLLSTLKSYFQGNKEVFEGLAVSKLEKEWKQYPVLHLDLNTALYNTPDALSELINYFLSTWEKEYSIQKESDDVSTRFYNIIVNTARQTPEGKAVILIDEYDKPLLETIGRPELQEKYRQILKAFYSNIKSCDEHIRFAMLTGVTKFSHLSIFSGLNNLRDISLDPKYADLCGFTQQELETVFSESIDEFADVMKVSREEMLELLKKNYDGYHFSRDVSVSVYNPFSILNAFATNTLNAFWFSTGTPSFLVEVIKHCDYPLDQLVTEPKTSDDLDAIDTFYSDPIPLFFQSGYLTIKDYVPRFDIYHLDFPNKEVEQGFAKFMAVYYHNENRNGGFVISKFVLALENGQTEDFMTLLQTFYSDNDYQLVGKLEVYFQNSLMVLFKLMGFYVQVERHTSRGRMDVIIQTKDYVYILELKVDKEPDEALQQIEEKKYAAPFATDPRKLFKIGVCFSSEERGIKDWKTISQ